MIVRHGAASQQGEVRALQRRSVMHDRARRVPRMTETGVRQRYSVAIEKSLSRQTSYSGKKKKKQKDPLGLGRHSMVSKFRYTIT